MDRSHYASLEAGFEELMAALGPTFTPEQAAEVSEFLSVSEYGLALETAVGVLLEKRLRPSARALAAIEGLAAQLGMADAPIVCGLRDHHLLSNLRRCQ
jgi:hypothetical protein